MKYKLREIAEENKKRILSALYTGPKTWNELLKITGFSRGTLAKHLKRLLDEGLISEEIDRRDRRIKIYRINEKGLEYLKDFVMGFVLYIKWILQITDFIKGRKKLDLKEISRMIGDHLLVSVCMGESMINSCLCALELFTKLFLKEIFEIKPEHKKALENISIYNDLNYLRSLSTEELIKAIVDYVTSLAIENYALEKGLESKEILEEIDEIFGKLSEDKKKKIIEEINKFTNIRKKYLDKLLALPPPISSILKEEIEKEIKEISSEELKSKRKKNIRRNY